MRRLRIHTVLALLPLLWSALSCSTPDNGSDIDIFRERADICVIVGRKPMIDFENGNIQSSFNEAKRLYRAGRPVERTDSTSGRIVETIDEYFVLSLKSIPSRDDDTVEGSLHLKASSLSSGFRTYRVNMEVIKKEGPLVWLWDPSQKVGVIARISE